MAIDRLPPLRCGAQPLAGKHGNQPSLWRGKLNVQSPSQKKAQRVQKSSQPLARRRPKGITNSLKLNTYQKAGSTRKVTKAAQSSSARGRKCSEIGHRLCRGTAPKKPTLSQPLDGQRAGKARKRKVRPPHSDIVAPDWVFDASVSEAEHLQNHSGSTAFCVRCDFEKRPKVYAAYSLHNGSSWLSRGVHRGKWGLGCTLCAQYKASGSKSDGSRFSKFAKFEVRPSSAFACRWQIEQHLESKSHRLAQPCVRARDRVDVSAERPQALPLACPSISSTDMPVVTLAEDVGRVFKNTTF